MKKLLFLPVMLWSLLLIQNAGASEIKIGLFYGKSVQTVVFSVVQGEYILSGDSRQVIVARTGSIFQIRFTNGKIALEDTSGAYGTFYQLEFKGVSAENVFQVRPVFPSLPPLESDDDLLITSADDALKIINRIGLEKYISGTLEAEGGSNALPEYYKAQAVLSRTYAINNFNRHAGEGFNLCDGEHCQAFKGKSHMNKEIYNAVNATSGEILVDSTNHPVIAPFHSNCGGITSSAAMAWSKDLPYLVPVKDPFCTETSNHHWTKTISQEAWKNYLNTKGIHTYIPAVLKPGRQKYIILGESRLTTAEMRRDLNLKSAYFMLTNNAGNIIIDGFGFGHGVGLCQQGAMEMANVGYTYVDILMFYFRGLHLMKIAEVK